MAHLKRLAKDIQTMVSDELLSLDIHYWYNEMDMRTGQGLIFGPEDTPYAFCPLVFSVKLPNDYPFASPEVLIMSSDSSTRFHPNLYVGGKVCLSILGTYTGPKWVSTMNIGTVFKSIFSLLNDNPIVNEPGWENHTLANPMARHYAEWVEFNLLKYTVHQYRDYCHKVPTIWSNFKDIFDGPSWKEKWVKIGDKIKRLAERGDKNYVGIPYGMSGTTKWVYLSLEYDAVSLLAVSK
uniref:UBC core domain-containing protein n=1 Tax=viral metagenome TaxID=1070528 RepID=A0A6C0JUR3_9ZZZZ